MTTGSLDRQVVALSAAATALTAIETPRQAVGVMRLAEAARVYARQAQLGSEAENAATAIRLKAEVKLAETVTEGQAAGEIATNREGSGIRNADTKATLRDLGVSPQRLSEARTIASALTLPAIDGMAEDANAKGHTLSRATVLREAHRSQPSGTDALPMNDVHRRKFPDLAYAELRSELTAALYAFGRPGKFEPESWSDRIGQLRPEDIAKVQQHLGYIRRWLVKWDRLLDRPALSVIEGSTE